MHLASRMHLASGERIIERLCGWVGRSAVGGRTRSLSPRRCNGGSQALRVRRSMLFGQLPRHERCSERRFSCTQAEAQPPQWASADQFKTVCGLRCSVSRGYPREAMRSEGAKDKNRTLLAKCQSRSQITHHDECASKPHSPCISTISSA